VFGVTVVAVYVVLCEAFCWAVGYAKKRWRDYESQGASSSFWSPWAKRCVDWVFGWKETLGVVVGAIVAGVLVASVVWGVLA
jgi:hypothetical protein